MSVPRFDAWFQSDAGLGRDAPGALGPLARASGLAGFALADAGTLDGLAGAAEGAAAAGVGFLAGVALPALAAGEASTVFGLGIDPASPAMVEVLEDAESARRQREAAVIAKLDEVGIRLPAGASPDAAALVAAGFSPSRHAALQRYLGPGGVAWVEPEVADAADLLAAVRRAHGRAALRPGPTLSVPEAAETLEYTVAGLMPAGLSALLACTASERAAWAPIASKVGLPVLGGSGYRGAGRGPDPGEAVTDAAGWAAVEGTRC